MINVKIKYLSKIFILNTKLLESAVDSKYQKGPDLRSGRIVSQKAVKKPRTYLLN